MRRAKTLFTALLCVAAVGCIRGDKPIDQQPSTSSKGTVDMSSVSLTFVDGSSQVTDYYQVVISDQSNQVAASGQLGSMTTVELDEGDYLLTVSSIAEAPVADWEKPYYVGIANISVAKDATSTVGAISTELKNVGVRVVFTDKFRQAMDEGFSVAVTFGLGRLTYSASETRTGYFRSTSAKQLLTAELTGSMNGQTVTEQRVVRDVAPGDVKIITFDVKEQEPDVPPTDEPDVPPTDEPEVPPTDEPGDEPGGEPGDKPGDEPDEPAKPEEGGVNLGFVIDVTVSNVDVNGNITVDENDREPAEDDDNQGGEGDDNGEGDDTPTVPDGPVDLGAPAIVWEGHDLNEWFDLTDGSVQVALNITAPNKIKTLVVDIISKAPAFQPDQLQGLGLDAHLDLGYPGDLRAAIEGLGFPVAENVVGKTELLFDISQFMPLMGIAAEDEAVEFQLTLTDDFGHELVTSLKMNVNLQ